MDRACDSAPLDLTQRVGFAAHHEPPLPDAVSILDGGTGGNGRRGGHWVFADFNAASVAVRLAPAAIDPDPETTKTYADAYRRYLAAFDAVESAMAR